jgi:hypothetical protein
MQRTWGFGPERDNSAKLVNLFVLFLRVEPLRCVSCDVELMENF